MTQITTLETCNGLVISHLTSSEIPAGHAYQVLCDPTPEGQHRTLASINFQNGPIPAVGVNGITNEALLTILIHRTEVLNAQYPCHENEVGIEFMRKALDAFEARTINRKARGVEGKMVK